MTKRDKILAFSPNDSLVSVIEQLAQGRFSGAPVIQEGRVVGVISESDLIGLEEKTGKEIGDLKARDVMTKNVVTVRPSADLADIAGTMSSKKINRVIVVDQQGQLAGLVARDDLMRASISEL